jgi:hypothetical protein
MSDLTTNKTKGARLASKNRHGNYYGSPNTKKRFTKKGKRKW